MTLIEAIPLLNEGCDHTATQGLCICCSREIAETLQHLIHVMQKRARIEGEIARLREMSAAIWHEAE